MAQIYYIINENNVIENIVMADSIELALIGTKNCTADTELKPQYTYPVLPTQE